jgi:hypothetical protein
VLSIRDHPAGDLPSVLGHTVDADDIQPGALNPSPQPVQIFLQVDSDRSAVPPIRQVVNFFVTLAGTLPATPACSSGASLSQADLQRFGKIMADRPDIAGSDRHHQVPGHDLSLQIIDHIIELPEKDRVLPVPL